MRSPRETLEHRPGLGGVGRLAEDGAVQHDHRVDAEHERLAPVDGSGLADRVLDGIVADLLVGRSDDLERDPQLLEDRPSLRRRGREDDHPAGRRRRCALEPSASSTAPSPRETR